MRRKTDPRSPVQDAGSFRFLLLTLMFAIALGGVAAWRNWDWLVDAYDGEADVRHSGPAPAKGDLYPLFSTDDYPMEAIYREEQGTVAFRLSISRRGRVAGCEIVRSSGSRALDAATCNILAKRARFVPARDAEGKRTTDEYSGRIRWVLPED